jgi:A/G-specific adenine glycosylase
VLVVAFGERRPLVDPNVIRLLGRALGMETSRSRARDDDATWEFVHELTPRRGAREFNLALVDLGAVVCRPRGPLCNECPLRSRCLAAALGTVSPRTALSTTSAIGASR